MTTKTEAERAVWQQFTSTGYRAHGVCANSECEHGPIIQTVCGRSPSTRICIDCFEFVYRCTHPTARRLAR